ncbi:hypothetical protein Tco_0603838 [Tanacetum coccineum]
MGIRGVPIPVIAPESGLSTALKMTVPSTAEEKICKKNDVKARSLLLMALPNEHQLTFDQYVEVQSMFAAIKARLGGNEATKKTQKALLKQQYENFNASSSESLDSIFNRLQKLVSRLAILGVVTPPEDLNVKFLRSLPSEWDTHVVVWMNKPDFDTMGLDDLYNNFKIVEQKVKRSAGAINDDKNMAFLTASGASSTNNINTVNPEVSTSTTKVNTASTEIRKDNKIKRSKNSQKPTRNGEDKKKSEDGKPNQSKAGSARYSKSMKTKMKVKGPIVTMDAGKSSNRFLQVYKEFLSLAHLLNKIKIGLQCQFEDGLRYFGDSFTKMFEMLKIEDKDELHDEDDATEESHDGSSLKENGTADPKLIAANQILIPVLTRKPHVVEDQEIELGNIPQSYEVPTTPHTRIHKDHPIKHVIGDVQSSDSDKKDENFLL